MEEYFQVGAFDGVVDRKDWDSHPSRLEHSIGILLELLARHQASATFFTLGWIAEPFYVNAMSDHLEGWKWFTTQYYKVSEMKLP